MLTSPLDFAAPALNDHWETALKQGKTALVRLFVESQVHARQLQRELQRVPT